MQAYDVVAPVVKSAADTAAPYVKSAADTVVSVAAPALKAAEPTVKVRGCAESQCDSDHKHPTANLFNPVSRYYL